MINGELKKLLVGGILLVLAMAAPLPQTLQIGLYVLAYIVCGWEVLAQTVKNLCASARGSSCACHAHEECCSGGCGRTEREHEHGGGSVFDENFLMTVATLGAFAIGEYPEGVAVMLFYQAGEMLQHRALEKSRQSISGLMKLRPEFARVLRGTTEETLPPEAVKPGEMILVRPGEKIPLDGVIATGTSSLDMSALTGESLPVAAEPGMNALAGCVNLSGALEIRVTKPYAASAVAKILELVQNAASKKTRTEHFIRRFARWYTPAVVAGAVLVAVTPPLIWADASFKTWVYRALVFLVLSCPCALVISVPLGFFGGLGGAAKHGVLIKGSNYLESLANLHTLIFDKTGTLTRGSFEVTRILPAGVTEAELLEWAAHAEYASNHPLALAVRGAYGKEPDASRVKSVRETAGKGVCAAVDGKTVLAGTRVFLEEHGVSVLPADEPGSAAVYVAVDGVFAGSVLLSDALKQDAHAAVLTLKNGYVRRLVLLSGDLPENVLRTARELELDEAYGGLLPADKLTHVERLLAQKPAGMFVGFAGDGINDAPVLARADVGIAMGALGSDAAIEAADVVLMTDEPSKVALAAQIARLTRKVVKQNIAFALLVKAAVLGLGLFGLATMWEAVFADVGVTVLAVFNSLRPLYFKSR